MPWLRVKMPVVFGYSVAEADRVPTTNAAAIAAERSAFIADQRRTRRIVAYRRASFGTFAPSAPLLQQPTGDAHDNPRNSGSATAIFAPVCARADGLPGNR